MSSKQSPSISTVTLVFGDQLTPAISSLSDSDPDSTLVLMAELPAEASYVPHHKKKIAFVFSAMRHFAEELRTLGWRVAYYELGETPHLNTFADVLEMALATFEPSQIRLTEPAEYRLRKLIDEFSDHHAGVVDVLEDSRFLCSTEWFNGWLGKRKQPRMEYFYREMRRQTDLLMDGDKPVGGKWNYDAANRSAASPDLVYPVPLQFSPDDITNKVLELVDGEFQDNFGELHPFWFAVDREQAESAFEYFVTDALPLFGDYQDAMLSEQRFLFHSVISHYLNIGLLDALTICKRVEVAYFDGLVPLNAAEGFIRQIIGWREYVRGIYWSQMPAYLDQNYFNVKRSLPSFYWSGDTDLHCLSKCIGQTRQEAYAHHIQRLMITGNFAMLIGVDPIEIHEWYLAVYADAYEWVELPNTLGMSQFADGGLLGSKPYASSGNYINKMSNYCSNCRYNVREKVGDDACPFNYLYWSFIGKNEKRLKNNARMKFAYRTWDKTTSDKKAEIAKSTRKFLTGLDSA
ncbi:MAG: cryptochrome/photolyase family protein [Pseudomonadota bacterium]